MLQSLRSASQSRAAKVLFGVLLLSFALWGVGPVFQGARVHTAATAGSTNISTTALDEAYRREVRNIEQRYGLSLTPEMAAKLNIKYQMAQQMVMQSLFDQEAAHLGLRLNLDMIKQTIASQPQLRDPQGKFSPQLFNQMLQNLGMSEATYTQTLRQDIIRTVLMGSVRAGATVPATLARRLYAYEHEKRVAEGKLFRTADMEPVADPTPEELAKFHTDNSTRYMAPEFRSLSYLVLDPAKLAESVTPTEEELRAAYDASPEAYAEPERRDLLQITTADEALARTLAEEAKTTPLADVATKHNVMAHPVAGLAKGDVLPALADVIFGLQPNVPSAAVQSPMGWHVIVVTGITPARASSFESAREAIVKQIKDQKAQEQADGFVRGLEDALAAGSTLAETAQKLGLPLVTIESVSAFGFRPDESEITDQPLLTDVLKVAYTLRDGDTSPVQQAEKGLFVVHVDGVTPSQVKPLEKVRDQVVTDWKNARREELARQHATALADQLRQTPPTAPPTATPPTFDRIGPFGRADREAGGLDTGAITALFGAKPGEILTSKTPEGVWVLRLAEIQAAPLDGVDLAPLQADMKEQLSNDLLEQFGAALRQSYGVTLNESWLRQAETDAQPQP